MSIVTFAQVPRFLLILLFFFIVPVCTFGQDTVSDGQGADSIVIVDTIVPKKAAATLPTDKIRNAASQDGPLSGLAFFVGIAVFLFFGLLRFFYSKYLNNLFSTLSRSTLWRLSSNERLWQNSGDRILFMLVYFLSGGFLAGNIIQLFTQMNLTSVNNWLLGITVITSAYLFKYLVIQSVALVFRFTKMANYFFRHLQVINQILGIVMLPICGVILILPLGLGKILVIISMLIFAIALIFKFLVNLAYVRNLARVNYMHFMVYLCTLEFIPLAVFARYAYSSMGV